MADNPRKKQVALHYGRTAHRGNLFETASWCTLFNGSPVSLINLIFFSIPIFSAESVKVDNLLYESNIIFMLNRQLNMITIVLFYVYLLTF